MEALEIRFEERDEHLIRRLIGTLDARAARAVAEAVKNLPLRPLTVDFSSVRTFVDPAIDALTLALRDKTVRLTGLGRHQQRMFRYFGLSSAESAEPAEA